MDSTSKSQSGAPVFRYTDGEKEWQSPSGEECIEEISGHIERHIGQINTVFHELLSDTVHIDIFHVLPSEKRPWHTLVTSGMSDLPMNVPNDIDSPRYMELLMLLPTDWRLSEADFNDEIWYWPIRQLKFMARFPHKFDTWFGWGHTMPNGDPAEPFARNTKLEGQLILPALLVDEEFLQLQISAEKTISFFSLVPLYSEEMTFKLDHGCDALLDRFDRYNVCELINLKRRNVIKKRFGIF